MEWKIKIVKNETEIKINEEPSGKSFLTACEIFHKVTHFTLRS